MSDDDIVVEGMNEQFKLPDGTTVGTGNLRAVGGPPKLLKAFPEDLLLEDDEIKKLLSRMTIEQARAKRKHRMRNQGQIGSCCPVSVVSCFEQAQERTGRPHVALQPEHLYMRINGGSDGGALLNRAMQAMVSDGCGPAGCVPYQSYRTSQAPGFEQANVEGKRFRMHEPFAMPTDYRTYVRAVASAVAREWATEIAWHVTGSSMRLMGGYCQVGNGPGNHASLLHWAEWVGGEDLIVGDLQNSWGPVANVIYGAKSTGWGEGGFGRVKIRNVFATRRYHEHFAVTSIGDDPKGVNPL